MNLRWVGLGAGVAAALLLGSCGGSSDRESGQFGGITGQPASADFAATFEKQRELRRKIAAPAQAQWSAVTDLSLVPASASALPDGKVLLWAGESRFAVSSDSSRTYSTLFDPVAMTATDRLVSETGHNMFCSGTTTLADGSLLVAGGSGESNTSIYNPGTAQWTTGPALKISRAYNANTILSDGSVLTIGGSWDLGNAGGKDGEVWNAATGWRKVPGLKIDSMLSPGGAEYWVSDSHFWLHPAGNGKVFHAGPGRQMHWLDTRGEGSVEAVGPRADDAFSITGSAVMYDTGRILKAGGVDMATTDKSSNQSYVIDLNAGVSVRKINPMAYPRAYHNAVVLPNGQVVVIGGQTIALGFSDSNAVMVPELFDPITETFTPMPAMSVPRNYHSVAVLLQDGRVMSAGGGVCGEGCAANHADLQILSPPYLFNADGSTATRPVLLGAPARAVYGSTVNVSTDSPVAAFSLVRMSSTTHTVNNDQRRLSLAFTSLGANNYRIDVPSNPGWALPGVYMLFAMNANGTPSVAKMVTIDGSGAPQLAAPDDQLSAVGSTLTLPVRATNPGGAPISYSADGLPDGLHIDAATGVISGSPGRIGTYVVKVAAAASGSTVSWQFQWVVNDSNPASRYVKLVSNSSFNDSPLASIADLDLLNEEGAVLPRGLWKATASSAETRGEYAPAAFAIDGNPDSYWLSQWSDPLAVQPHSFVIDMGSMQRIGGFAYRPRQNSDNSTIARYDFYVSADGVNWGPPVSQGDLRDYGPNPGRKTVHFNNVARGRPASASSEQAGGAATRAVDGVNDGNWASGSTTQTGSSANPWWEVDLGADFRIHALRLWNRTDCCADQLGNFQVMVSSAPMSGRSYEALMADDSVGKTLVPGTAERLTTLTPGATGRYVRVQLAGTGALSLAEVEVFGVPAANRPPSLGAVAPPATHQGEQAAFALAASDPDGDPLAFEVSGLPAGVNYDAASGMIAGYPSQSGNFSVTATVSDGHGGTASSRFDWRILNPLPVIEPIAAPAVGAGRSASYTASAGADGSLQYSWVFGDGSPSTGWIADGGADTTHAFAAPGVYNVTVSARSADGTVVTRSFMQAVIGREGPPAGAPGGPPAGTGATSAIASSILAVEPRAGASERVWVLNQDADTVSVFDSSDGYLVAEIAVGVQPRSVSLGKGIAVVANKGAASLSVLGTGTLKAVRTVDLPRGSQPYGVLVAPDGSTYVALEATGRLLKFDNAWTQTADVAAPGVRHLALSADGKRLLATRFITAPQPGEGTASVRGDVDGMKTGGEVTEFDPATLAVVRRFVLQHSDKADGSVQARGVPNYLGAPAIAPDGQSAWIPSKQDNIRRGGLRDGQPLSFESTVRAISSRLDLATNTEDYPGRVDHDNSGVASAAVYHPNGAYIFVALESSREVAVLDAAGKRELMRLAVGRAPQGVAVSTDGMRLYVSNFMDRTVGAYDLGRLLQYGEPTIGLIGAVPGTTTERLAPEVLRGKQFFYDARDPRLARDAYLSCASCHNDASHDGRTWDFTSLGEGLRNTISLRGRAGGQGRLHWSGNFDEPQDFEGQIRNLARGTGLMTDAAFNAGTRSQPLGDPKEGQSADLDALAAYLRSLNAFSASPLRSADGSLTAQAVNGKTVFAAQCATCHGGPAFTDSATNRLHNVGTLKPGSGKRLGAPLNGLDTPTLRDVWATAPYLHDGTAATVEDAVRAHANLSLSDADLLAVSAFVKQIGNEETRAPHVPGSGTGLLGSYFNNITLSGQPALVRVEPVDFDWGLGSPGAPIGVDFFSARWTGMIEAPATGSYQFRTLLDDGVRLWIDDKLMIDHWTYHPDYDTTAPLNLVAGRLYRIRVEYFEWTHGASMRLEWKPPGAGAFSTTPAERLYPG
ncbi:discoidin domain-containing protein [Variovorax sp. dw_954]|uniref:discoidin domain-containing protein n=1 Tax=Variovorax sp. dw_954 TaxID=2720078 RepID=UPI001BD5D0BA